MAEEKGEHLGTNSTAVDWAVDSPVTATTPRRGTLTRNDSICSSDNEQLLIAVKHDLERVINLLLRRAILSANLEVDHKEFQLILKELGVSHRCRTMGKEFRTNETETETEPQPPTAGLDPGTTGTSNVSGEATTTQRRRNTNIPEASFTEQRALRRAVGSAAARKDVTFLRRLRQRLRGILDHHDLPKIGSRKPSIRQRGKARISQPASPDKPVYAAMSAEAAASEDVVDRAEVESDDTIGPPPISTSEVPADDSIPRYSTQFSKQSTKTSLRFRKAFEKLSVLRKLNKVNRSTPGKHTDTDAALQTIVDCVDQLAEKVGGDQAETNSAGKKKNKKKNKEKKEKIEKKLQRENNCDACDGAHDALGDAIFEELLNMIDLGRQIVEEKYTDNPAALARLDAVASKIAKCPDFDILGNFNPQSLSQAQSPRRSATLNETAAEPKPASPRRSISVPTKADAQAENEKAETGANLLTVLYLAKRTVQMGANTVVQVRNAKNNLYRYVFDTCAQYIVDNGAFSGLATEFEDTVDKWSLAM